MKRIKKHVLQKFYRKRNEKILATDSQTYVNDLPQTVDRKFAQANGPLTCKI